MCEELLIGPIHLHEVIHACQEHIDLNHLRNIGASGFQDGREILDAEFSHLGDGGGRLCEDFAGRCAWDLAGAVDCGGGGYSLGLSVC